MNPKAAEHFMRNALERGKDKSMFCCAEKRRWLTAKEAACGYKALVPDRDAGQYGHHDVRGSGLVQEARPIQRQGADPEQGPV